MNEEDNIFDIYEDKLFLEVADYLNNRLSYTFDEIALALNDIDLITLELSFTKNGIVRIYSINLNLDIKNKQALN